MTRFSVTTIQKLLRTSLSAVLASGLVSCSSSNTGSTAAQSPQGFDARWARDCRVNSDGVTSYIDIVTVDGESSERIRESYTDTGCQLLSASTAYDVTVEYGEQIIDPQSGLTAYLADMVIGEIRITPGTEETATSYNDRSLCGVTGYAENVVTVVATECEIFNFGTGRLYSIWAVGNDLLYFGGNPTDSITLENRPTSLDVANPFRRQSS